MSDWKLKILSGRHIGSELDLAWGTYRCGSDDSDDLIFQDLGLRPAHFELEVSERIIRLIRLPVNEDVDPPEFESEVLEPGELVVIEGFQFAVANGPIDWPEPTIKPDTESSKENEGHEGEGHDNDGEVAEEPSTAELAADPLPDSFPKRGRPSAMQGLRVKLGVVGACTGLLMLLAAGSMTSAQNSEDLAFGKSSAQNASLLENRVKQQLNLSDIQVFPMADGLSWSVEGYVESSNDMDRLNQWIETNGLEMTLKVKITEELIKGAEIALTALGYSNVSVHKGEQPGYLVLTGNVDDDVEWQKNRGRLQVDVPGVLGFEDKVTADTKLALAPFPNLVVKGIYMGKTPFFVLSNGEKYFVGSQLEYGYRVEDIAPSMLQLRRGDKLIQYRLGAE